MMSITEHDRNLMAVPSLQEIFISRMCAAYGDLVQLVNSRKWTLPKDLVTPTSQMTPVEVISHFDNLTCFYVNADAEKEKDNDHPPDVELEPEPKLETPVSVEV